MADVS
jgi:NAD(P)-dependent dehydrogenase (short-subunit alcohol dehydrogenase family)